MKWLDKLRRQQETEAQRRSKEAQSKVTRYRTLIDKAAADALEDDKAIAELAMLHETHGEGSLEDTVSQMQELKALADADERLTQAKAAASAAMTAEYSYETETNMIVSQREKEQRRLTEVRGSAEYQEREAGGAIRRRADLTKELWFVLGGSRPDPEREAERKRWIDARVAALVHLPTSTARDIASEEWDRQARHRAESDETPPESLRIDGHASAAAAVGEA